jgi:quercetin dioxygenase-like cupin family protein
VSAARVVRREDEVPTTYGAGDDYRFLATGRHTDGAYFLMEGRVPPGAGPPPHVQMRDEEMFYVLEGTLVFWVGDERDRVEAGPGTFLHVPRGMMHNFRNETDTDARLLLMFAPAGIETMFERMGADPENYQAIGAEFGVTFPETG